MIQIMFKLLDLIVFQYTFLFSNIHFSFSNTSLYISYLIVFYALHLFHFSKISMYRPKAVIYFGTKGIENKLVDTAIQERLVLRKWLQ